MGFTLPGHSREDLESGLLPNSSHTLSPALPEGEPDGASEYRSALAWSGPREDANPITGRTALLGFPHRRDPEHSGLKPFGLWVHLVP